METRRDVLIWGLWESQTDAIIDVRFGYSGVDTYNNEPIDNLQACWMKHNKDNQGNHCNNEQKYFPSFFISIDGIIGKKALIVLANLS